MTARESIRQLADQYTQRLNIAIGDREAEMQGDDLSHYLIYRVLGISVSEGCLIDVYQNKGRFLYKYAGSFLEEATKLCFKEAFPNSGSLRINNMRGQRPRTFEIDCLEETMRSKSSGGTLLQMVITLRKSIQEFRSYTMPAINLFG